MSDRLGIAKKKPKPAHIVKVGRTSIPIYAIKRKGDPARVFYQCRYYVAGVPARISRADLAEIIEEAEGKANGIENGRVQAGDLSAADVQSFYHAQEKLAELGSAASPLHVALDDYVAAIKLLPSGMGLADAVRAAVRAQPTAVGTITLADLLPRFLATVGDTVKNPRHRRGIRCDLERFVSWLTPGLTVGQLSADLIRKYLRDLCDGKMTDRRKDRWGGRLPKGGKWPPIGPRRRDNVLSEIKALLTFAKHEGDLPDDRDTVADHIRALKPVHEVAYYTPEQVCAFLAYAREEWIPWLVLTLFAGLRTSEVVGDPEDPARPRLKWSDFRWDKGYVVVPKLTAQKIKRSRRAPLRANVLEWLLPWRNATGYLYEERADQSEETYRFEHGLRTWDEAAGKYVPGPKLDWSPNAHRHSYGTYRNAELNNAGQLAEEMGTSVPMVRKNYDAVPADIEPKDYFGIRPEPAHARKIIGMDGKVAR